MKKYLLRIISIALLLVLPLSFANAESYFQTESNGEEINHSLFSANESITSKDNVKGINFVAGNNVNVTGTSEYGLFAGNSVNISGTIEKDLFAAGNIITISKDANISRDVYIAGNEIIINSNINGNLFIAGSSLTLSNVTINGNISFGGEKVFIEDNVTINGKLSVNEDIKIYNEAKLTANSIEKYKVDSRLNIRNAFVDFITSLATFLVLGFILLALFPKLYDSVVKDFDANNTLRYMFHGIIALIIIPFISILSFISLVGSLVGVVLLLAYIIMLLTGTTITSLVIGDLVMTKLFKKEANKYLSLIIGLVTISLVGLIPVVGALLYFLAFIYGLGKILEIINTGRK